ncbi:hypothetical protein QTL95_26150 [Rhizobium sp. S152]|uniref:hypothetical protein n=1 Tax=Rhizobium sp. S152 TaxID=3055038 RepID=UPI0025AA2B5F|nr:hypothetical protein [Rhizobium sp. S152]MDM9629375.1 hypothetical protein [Rhizobium sp. S152]
MWAIAGIESDLSHLLAFPESICEALESICERLSLPGLISAFSDCHYSPQEELYGRRHP